MSLSSLFSFFRPKNRRWRRILIYSEGRSYTPYFEGLLASLLEDGDTHVSYITSDAADPIRSRSHPRLKTFHFDRLLPYVLLLTDSKVVVMTVPDLNQFHLKRSLRGGHYVYLFHSIVSSHMIYRKGAFDHYDSILCVGPHHVKEIEETERLYGLKPKTLVPAGYYRLEKLYQDHRGYRPSVDGKETALVAPSWGDANILESCLPGLVAKLKELGYGVVIRPHRETLKNKASPGLAEVYAQEDVILDRGEHGDRWIHEASLLATDWSGAAFSYAFGTERPVLFIDVPRKVRNPDYAALGVEPIEVSLRPLLGRIVDPRDLTGLSEAVSDLKRNRDAYRKSILDLRERTVFHFGESAKRSADYVRKLANA